MRIVDSQISMSSDHSRVDLQRRRESLRVWGDVPGRVADPRGTEENPSDSMDVVDLSERMRDFQFELTEASLHTENISARGASRAKTADETEETESLKWNSKDVKLEIMRLIVEQMTGEKVQLVSMEGDGEEETEGGEGEAAAAEGEPERVGWGVEYELHEIELESEQTSFSSSGVVKTADGKEIAFDVQLEMNREHVEIRHLSLRAGDAKVVDPLVINFGGSAAQLTDAKIDFDLDADGDSESVSFVRAGSGFLALDRNRDGIVNDGTELFGPRTGDGFDELAAHDEDGNGWIDEGDSVYSDLQIWTRTADGAFQLSNLKDRNVGAIHLDRAYTPFDLKDAENNTDGVVRSTGVYLSEDGEAGTVQQVDLVT
ncbi:MAG: hypothetical protein GY854_06505 [Deltaproteobacteria bacterium]|nr:hypothetical protein [Deltaproteobacteria bacterium]